MAESSRRQINKGREEISESGRGYRTGPMGILAGIADSRIDAPLNWFRRHLRDRDRRALSNLGLGSFIACVTAWLLSFPCLVVLGHFFGVDGSEPFVPELVLTEVASALGLLPLTLVAGFAHDIRSQ